MTGRPDTNHRSRGWSPALVCEVRFAEWTDEGLMRQPVFLGLREDLDPGGGHQGNPGGGPAGRAGRPEEPQQAAPSSEKEGASSSSMTPGSIYEPRQSVLARRRLHEGRRDRLLPHDCPLILPYLKDRPESLHRHPNGMTGEAFFQKNVEQPVPDWVKTVRIRSESEERDIALPPLPG